MTPLASDSGTEHDPGEVLLHPLAVLGLLVLVANDHLLKVHYPSWLSGKLSDFAVLLVLPLWTLAFWQWCARWGRVESRPRIERRVLGGAIIAVGAFYAAMEVTSFGDAAYRYGLGFAQWPFRSLASWVWVGAAAEFRPVRATPDVTDLICLPTLLVTWSVGKRFTGAIAKHKPCPDSAKH